MFCWIIIQILYRKNIAVQLIQRKTGKCISDFNSLHSWYTANLWLIFLAKKGSWHTPQFAFALSPDLVTLFLWILFILLRKHFLVVLEVNHCFTLLVPIPFSFFLELVQEFEERFLVDTVNLLSAESTNTTSGPRPLINLLDRRGK